MTGYSFDVHLKVADRLYSRASKLFHQIQDQELPKEALYAANANYHKLRALAHDIQTGETWTEQLKLF